MLLSFSACRTWPWLGGLGLGVWVGLGTWAWSFVLKVACSTWPWLGGLGFVVWGLGVWVLGVRVGLWGF